MSIEEVLKLLEEKEFVIKHPKTGKLEVQKKWYEIMGYRRPGVQDLEKLAADYLDLWPPGVKSGGMYVRSGITTIIAKLRAFFKQFPHYTDQEILAATRRYIDESRRDNYQYMKTAEYFILKNGGSVLESYCELVRNSGTGNYKSFENNLRVG